MKKKSLITIRYLIEREGKWWGGQPPIFRYDTGWVKVSDWSKAHLHPVHKTKGMK